MTEYKCKILDKILGFSCRTWGECAINYFHVGPFTLLSPSCEAQSDLWVLKCPQILPTNCFPAQDDSAWVLFLKNQRVFLSECRGTCPLRPWVLESVCWCRLSAALMDRHALRIIQGPSSQSAGNCHQRKIQKQDPWVPLSMCLYTSNYMAKWLGNIVTTDIINCSWKGWGPLKRCRWYDELSPKW